MDGHLIIAYRKDARGSWIPLLAALEDAGWLDRVAVTLADGDAAPLDRAVANAMEETRAAKQTAVLCFSMMTSDVPVVEGVLNRIEEIRRPEDIVVAGGSHPTARPWETLALGVDAVVAGEGERVFAELIARICEDRDWRETPALRFMDGERRVDNPMGEPVDLDTSRSVIPRLGIASPVELTRGCRHGCRFCQTPRLWHGRERHRSVTSALRLAERYQIFLQFLTPNALGYRSEHTGKPNVAAIAELLSTILLRYPKVCINLGNFPSEVRPEYVTREVIGEMRRLCANRVMAVGAQSGCPRLLKETRRGHTVDDIYRAVEIIRDGGFIPFVDVMFGLPTETQAEQAMTREMVARLTRMEARVRGHVFMPLPGSRYENDRPALVHPETAELLTRLGTGGAVAGDWRGQLPK